MNIAYEICIAFIGSIPALFLTLWFDRLRMPKLEINAEESANADNTYPSKNGERWKFFRVSVKNKPFPLFSRIILRQTAENCRSKIEFSKIGSESESFSMIGRWSSTPELPYISTDATLKLLYPDPVTIPVNSKEFLDVVTKYDRDFEAYGWNNEAYVHNWRTPQYKLSRGSYIVKVTISTQNGVTFNNTFKLVVSDKIEDTSINNL